MEPVLEYMRVQNFLDCSLNRLREVEMQLIYGVQQELEFIKFLLAKMLFGNVVAGEVHRNHIFECLVIEKKMIFIGGTH